jgi:uncharacterized protein (TIGR03067 family)
MNQALLIMGCYAGLVCFAGDAPRAQLEPPPGREAAREDLKKMQGSWERVVMEFEGNEAPAEELKGWIANYEEDQLTLKLDNNMYRRGIVTLEPTRKPKAMNTWDQDGPFADQTVPGIYELDGDTTKVCFAEPGEKRPTEFTTKRGTGFLYCEYKRRKE